MSQPKSVITLQNLTRRFGDLTAVDQVSLDLKEGEFFALLGPSGCGKTTLLRMIAGFETPDSGKILLDGEDIAGLRPNRRPVNMMFQSYALFPHMSVQANVAYGLEMEKFPRAEVKRRTAEILQKTELTELATRKPTELSGGQRQRVALARAIVKQPRVLLLDEPLGALDKKLREQMQLELKRLQHEFGITFVVVTHDQDEALVMADRIALMNQGRVVQASSPRELYDQPENRFVADFIGASNFIPGTVTAQGLETTDHGLLQLDPAPTAAPGTKAIVAVRPERIKITLDSALAGSNAVIGNVSNIAYHGQSVKLIVNVAGLEQSLIVELTATEEEQIALRQGQQVWCNWLPKHGRLLID